MLPHNLQDELRTICSESPGLTESPFACLLKSVQEGVVVYPRIALAFRLHVGSYRYIRLNVEDMLAEEITTSHYLAFKEKLADGLGGDG